MRSAICVDLLQIQVSGSPVGLPDGSPQMMTLPLRMLLSAMCRNRHFWHLELRFGANAKLPLYTGSILEALGEALHTAAQRSMAVPEACIEFETFASRYQTRRAFESAYVPRSPPA